MKIYFLYHAAVGTLSDFPLAEPPSADAIEKVRAKLAERHGHGHVKLNDPTHPAYREGHPLNGSDWDMRVEERDVLDGIGPILESFVPRAPAAALAGVMETDVPVDTRARGFVRNSST